ncbi:ABC transporter ATP-binding protein [Fictibacillus aquaticus]|uniref:Bacitracin ABC transporter ATP-binding protein n=1 Tax=Fictibacillus aquaticus TaxID=2021314 RepID=A0A235F8A5_9BACL|nr:ATP-binding cassette domain-containing protein [Fictibacillus aquaticus]OYD57498.1 bacitracin ABC transporter ATP-binding protein [Fictibacillus aquaticus]
MSEFTLELKNVSKRLKKKNVVDDLSFSVRKGEVFGLLGPNGAGKTTTIRMIVGLISMTSGEVMINGLSVKKDFEKAMTHVGAIVENPQLYDYLTGYKNLMQYARILPGITKERIQEVIKLVDLEAAIHHKVKTYSLGMRQRLGVAQALLHKPSLLILDEPTNGLDPQGIYDLRNYLRQLANNGTSVMVSSHMLAEMQMMCDRVAIIQEGKLIEIQEITNVSEQEIRVEFEIDGDLKLAQKLVLDTVPDAMTEIVGSSVLAVQSSVDLPIAGLNRQFILAGLDVSGISKKSKTLEEKFLETTKKGGGINETTVAHS